MLRGARSANYPQSWSLGRACHLRGAAPYHWPTLRPKTRPWTEPHMSAAGQPHSSKATGTCAATAAAQGAARWVGRPVREAEGRTFHVAFEAAGQQFNLGERWLEAVWAGQQWVDTPTSPHFATTLCPRPPGPAFSPLPCTPRRQHVPASRPARASGLCRQAGEPAPAARGRQQVGGGALVLQARRAAQDGPRHVHLSLDPGWTESRGFRVHRACPHTCHSPPQALAAAELRAGRQSWRWDTR